ncbi:MAG: peptidoglycan editing factor PgeF [Emergencia sp.]
MRDYTQNYHLHSDGERQYLTFPRLEQYKELRHLFTTRRGGVSTGCCASWNFGARTLDTEENIRRNYELLAETLGTTAEHLATSAQTHTVNIREVTAADGGKGACRERDYDDVDGLVTDEKGLAIVTGHADCNAVFFFDPQKQVIGLAHSGWRGTLGGISAAMVNRMETRYGSRPEDIIAGIGPSLCRDCFEVDTDVAELFFEKNHDYRQYAYRRGVKYYIDLKKIIRKDLLDAGLREENLLDMGLCTRCDTDTFFSHRGQKGKRGIMAAAMMLVQPEEQFRPEDRER